MEGFARTITAIAPVPGWWVVLVTGLFAALVVAASFAFLVTGTRRVLTNFNLVGTIFHEAGHASVSVLTGGGVYRFEITGPDAGSVNHWYPSKLSSIVTTAAGYAAPSLAGLGAAALLHRGHAAAVLTLTVLTMLLLLLVTKDAVTFGCVVLVGILAFATLFWGPAWLRAWVAYVEAWLLLTSEISGVAVLVVNRFAGGSAHRDDAASLAEQTHIPGVVWIAGWFFVIGWALWNGVPMLWP